jgi:hypothetical protein
MALGTTMSCGTISGVACRFSSSQSSSFTITAATDCAMPAEAQETTTASSQPSRLAM